MINYDCIEEGLKRHKRAVKMNESRNRRTRSLHEQINSKFYQDFDTGEFYTLDELKKLYNDFEHEMNFDSFDDFLNYKLELGRSRVGGFVECDSLEEI